MLSLGIKSTQQQPLVRSFGYERRDSISQPFRRAATLLLREAPECHHQWQAESINFLAYGDIISQSSEISTAIELSPLCAALLHQDLRGLSQILATRSTYGAHPYQYEQSKSSDELLLWRPEALKHILETVPGFFSPQDLGALFRLAIKRSHNRCRCQRRRPLDKTWENCSCSEAVKVLLENSCPLMCEDIRRIFRFPSHGSRKVHYEVLKHLGAWRWKLYELFSRIYPQNRPAVHQPGLLDHEAPYVVKKLQEVNRDPYEIFRLERDDYRLGRLLHSVGTVYHMINDPVDAEMAFDIGFRDVDTICKGVTPLSRIQVDNHLWRYCAWLIYHGADYTRELTWITENRIARPRIIEPPKYRILHWILRLLRFWSLSPIPLMHELYRLNLLIPGMVRSSWFSHLKKSIYYDGCSVSRVWS